jgi:uncharacterized protein YecT (DUF1311 family)
MRTAVICLVAAAGLAQPVLAQASPQAEALVFDPAPAQACRDAAASAAPETAAACTGHAADACMEATPGGFSTVGMNGCLEAELLWWDTALNDVYGQLKSLETELQAETEQPDSVPRPSVALTDMQRAWIDYRDARCLYAASQWSGGTGAGPAHLSCSLQATAEQTLFLDARLRDLTTR